MWQACLWVSLLSDSKDGMIRHRPLLNIWMGQWVPLNIAAILRKSCHWVKRTTLLTATRNLYLKHNFLILHLSRQEPGFVWLKISAWEDWGLLGSRHSPVLLSLQESAYWSLRRLGWSLGLWRWAPVGPAAGAAYFGLSVKAESQAAICQILFRSEIKIKSMS